MGAETSVTETHLSLPGLQARGLAIGATLAAPAVVTLSGDLGAGKTTMVQAICRGLGVTDVVTSPTFGLIHEYAARAVRVVHCDLYRLESFDAVARLGLDDYLADAQVILLVEWPDRAEALLGAPTLKITLEHLSDHPSQRRCIETWAS